MNDQNQHADIFTGEKPLPNATTVLVLGILSIVLCFICGIVGLYISGGDRKLYAENPGVYSPSSYDLLKAGRICSIIGLAIWGLVLLIYLAIFFIAIGVTFLNR